jgi:hypothetical protein
VQVSIAALDSSLSKFAKLVDAGSHVAESPSTSTMWIHKFVFNLEESSNKQMNTNLDSSTTEFKEAMSANIHRSLLTTRI